MEVQPEPSGTKRAVAFAVVLMLILGVIACGLVYIWQHNQVTSLKEDVATSQASVVEAQDEVKKLQAEVADLTSKEQEARRAAKKAEKALKEQKAATKQAKQQQKQAQQQANSLPAGKYYGTLSDVEGGNLIIKIDIKEFLTGKKAEKAARRDGVIKKGESLKAAYYIRNATKVPRTLHVASNATVKLLDQGKSTTHTVSFEDFAKTWNDPSTSQKHVKENNYFITISGSKVTKLEEQYLKK